MKTNDKFQVGQKLSWSTFVNDVFTRVKGEITKIISVEELDVETKPVLITFVATGTDHLGNTAQTMMYDADPSLDFLLFERKEIEENYPSFHELFLSKLPKNEQFGEVYTEKDVASFLKKTFEKSFVEQHTPKEEEAKKQFYVSLFECLDKIQSGKYKGIFHD